MHKWHIIKLLLLEFQAWNFNIMLQACYSHLGYIETPTKSWLTTKSCITVSLWEANEIRFYCSSHYLFTESWYVEYRDKRQRCCEVCLKNKIESRLLSFCHTWKMTLCCQEEYHNLHFMYCWRHRTKQVLSCKSCHILWLLNHCFDAIFQWLYFVNIL